MKTIMLGCFLYNLAYVCEGRASRLNVIGLVLVSISMAGRWLLMWRQGSAGRRP